MPHARPIAPPEENGVILRPAADGKGDAVLATRSFAAGETVMCNFTIDYFPDVCLCGAQRCRGSVTGWKDLPETRKADYGELVAPYLRAMDDEMSPTLQ